MALSCYLIGADTLLGECGDLLLRHGHSIRGVVSNASKVRDWAQARGLRQLPLDSSYVEVLRAEPFDYLFAITHLAILPPEVVSLPARGAINFHDGPLPRYAGLNAPAWALMNGESTYGVTWHTITAGVDEGEILEQRSFELADRESSLTLNTRNFEAAIESFEALLSKLADGTVRGAAQELSLRSYYGKHQRPQGAGLLDWTRPARELDALVRALDFGRYDNPLGLAKVWLGDRALGVVEASPVPDSALSALPQAGADAALGTVLVASDDVWVKTGSGVLRLIKLQSLSGRELEGSVASALGVKAGDRLPEPSGAVLSAIGDTSEKLSRSEAFWERRLSACEPAEIVVARAHKAEPAAAGGVASAGPPRSREWLHADVVFPDALRARFEGRTQAAVLAAVGLYLGRTSGKREFVMSYAGPAQRSLHQALGELVAPFVPLVFNWEPETSFEQLVERAEAELRRLSDKGSYLKDLIARKPRLREQDALAVGAHAPVAITLRADGDAAETAPGELPEGVLAEFSLGGQGLRLRLEAGAFSDEARQLDRQLAALFDSLAHDLDAGGLSRPCRDISLLSPDERQRVLYEWNESEGEVAPAGCIHELFEAQVARTPDRDAVVFRGERISYADLNARANALAHTLQSQGVGADQLVGVMVERSIELLVATLGVLKAGGAYVPLDPAYPEDRIAYMLADSGARWVVTGEAFAALVPSAVRPVLVGPGSAPPRADRPSSSVGPQHLAYVIYTSGSTGKPKGVMVEHRNVANFFSGMDRVLPREDGGVWLAVTSLSFDISVLELFWTLSRGLTVILHRDDDKGAMRPHDAPGAARLTPGKPLAFGLFLWGADDRASADKYEVMLHAGRFGDEHGFAAVWTPERHFHAFGGPYPNPSVTGAALAAVTQHIQIRGGSCVVPLHHPVRVAEEWAVVDNLSSGRAGISFASGWQPDDFLLQPQNFKENKRVMAEAIDQVRRLWRGEALTFENGLGKPVSVVTQPRPIQKELPYWVTTAGNPETFRAAGEMGANLLTHLLGQSVEELAGKVKAYREARASAGFDPKTGIVSLMLHTYVGVSDAVVRERVREPMKHYLRTSVNLIKGFAWAFPAFKRPAKGGGEELDLGGLSEQDLDTILEFAFERYYETSGLFGTVDSCLSMIERVRGIDVDEIACLIDFGVPAAEVKEGLVHLARLKARVDAELGERRDSRATAGAPSEASEVLDYSLAALARRHAPTHLQCTPSLMRMAMLDPDARAALLDIPHLMVGGEALPLALAQELASRSRGDLTNMYGPTETTVWSATYRFPSQPEKVRIGRPILNTQLYVLDACAQPVPVGVPGELYIGGHGVVRGYHGRPELTSERFVKDPFRPEGARMYRTGDLVRFLGDGSLEFLGRTDHQVKIRGHRIELGEIETRLTSHPSVDEGVVMAREDTPGDQRLVAYYTGQASEDELRQHIKQVLPEFMVPAVFVTLPRMPHTPNGKIDRKALPAPERQRRAAEVVAPESEVEAQVAALWQEVLGLDQVGVNDNFFDLGGHSLLVVRLHQLLKKALSPSIPMTSLYRFPTIRAFVQNLDGGERSDAAEQAKDRGQARREQLSRLRGNRARPRS